MIYKPTLKCQALSDVLQYDYAAIEPFQISEIRVRGFPIESLLSTGIYRESGEDMIASGPNQDLAVLIGAFYRYTEGATIEQLQEFVRDAEGVELAHDAIERAVWAGLVASQSPPITYIVYFEDGSSISDFGTSIEIAEKYPHAIDIREA